MTYKEVVLNALLIPHISLSIDEIHKLTKSHHGSSIIHELRCDGVSIIDCRIKNTKSKKYYNRYFIGRKF